MPHDSHEHYMSEALALATKGHAEGGCPIGAVLVDDTGRILGKGHNALVQEGNPIVHGEMAALRDAGRLPDRHATTIYTTLQPCFMCTGAILQFGIPRVVIGDATNASSDDTIRVLRSRGVEVVVLDPETSAAARGCVDIAGRFRRDRPELWLEDWGGGANPRLTGTGGALLRTAIPVLQVTSSERADAFYCGRLGFTREFAYRPFDTIDPCYMGLSRDGAVLHVSSFSGDGAKGSATVILCDNVDALHRELVAKGVAIDTGPIDQDYGTREMYIKDEDRNSLRFTQAR
jgi:cytosine deaminase